jgi:hypothetical protein
VKKVMTGRTPAELELAISAIREMKVLVRAANARRRFRESSAKRQERKAQQEAQRKIEQAQRKAAREAKPKKTRYVRKPSMPERQKKAGRPLWGRQDDKTICTKCKQRPRVTGQRWCSECRRDYMRGYDRVQDAS